MAKDKRTRRTCPSGHEYWKSSDCPTCPTCEATKRPASGLLAEVSAPARRALEAEGIKSVAELATYSEARLLTLHGLRPSTIPRLPRALEAAGLSFKHEG